MNGQKGQAGQVMLKINNLSVMVKFDPDDLAYRSHKEGEELQMASLRIILTDDKILYHLRRVLTIG